MPMSHGVDAQRAMDFFGKAFARMNAPEEDPVPPVRIVFDDEARREVLERVDRALFTGNLTLGPTGAAFERAVAVEIGAPDVVAVSSGTSAIEIALRTIGVAGRRVLIPANTFFATASAALAAGAVVDFVDTEAEGLGADPRAVAAKLHLHDDVAAVIVVHIGGIVSPHVPEIAALCRARGVALLEDAAHALGSLLDGKPAGSFGRLAAFSFYPTKVVTSAEGGVVTTWSPEDAASARCLRDHGKIGFHANVHDRIGSNWRLSEVHAAIGLAHMGRLGAFIAERRAAATYYDEHLSGISGITPFGEPSGERSNYYKYLAILDPAVDRAALKAMLRQQRGVILSGEIYDPLCCLQPALQGRFDVQDFPVAFAFSQRHVCLPIFPGITRGQQDRVVAALRVSLALCTARDRSCDHA